MRYKKIDPAMYGDEKFRALSRPAPNGRSLWVFLLTGPHTTPLPGLSSAGEAGLAEALGWTIGGFRRAFAEIAKQGMARADWEARVLWIPRAIRYNEPENPSVVKGWLRWLDEIPQCDLKREAVTEIGQHLSGLGPAWVAAWTPCGRHASHVPDTLPDTLPDTCTPTSATSGAGAGAVAGAVAGAGTGTGTEAGAGERDSPPLPPLSRLPQSHDGKPSRRHVDAAWGRTPNESETRE